MSIHRANHRRVTASDIANKLGVSQPTVSTILSGAKGSTRVSDELREKVTKLAKELGYRPNAVARSMVKQSTRNIGVLIAAQEGDLFTAQEGYLSILGINDRLQASDYITSIVRIDEMKHQLETQSRATREIVFDGVIAIGAIPLELRASIEKLFGYVVWLDTDIREPQRCITRDEFAVGNQIGQQVVKFGYQKTLWVTDPIYNQESHYSLLERKRGFINALESTDIQQHELHIFWEWSDDYLDLFDPHWSPDTAVVAMNFQRMRLALRAGMARGLYPGKDYGLVCCDSTQEVLLTWPDLSHVHYPRYGAGRMAADLLLELIAHPNRPCKSKQIQSDWMPGKTLPDRNVG